MIAKSAAVLAVAALSAVASADVYNWSVHLDGPSESPANGSPGVGFALITWDTVAHTMTLDVTFSGLVGTTTASHIHAATASPGTSTAGVATQTPSFTGFPLGVTSGSYLHVFDMTDSASYNASFVTANGSVAGAEAALLNAMLTNRAYLNIHSSAFPGGEIRGFIPTPGAISLVAMAGLAINRRRR
ncbi:MAG: CHRD domain-containing protein [Phycisphaerales bacterium]